MCLIFLLNDLACFSFRSAAAAYLIRAANNFLHRCCGGGTRPLANSFVTLQQSDSGRKKHIKSKAATKKWRADLCAARAVVLSRACNEVGHGRSPCAFSRRFCAVKSGAAGGGSFHDLRHTFATMALQNGVDVKTVSSMLGHYSAGFTLDTYAHVTTDAQLKAAQTMGNILSRAV